MATAALLYFSFDFLVYFALFADDGVFESAEVDFFGYI